MPRSTRERIIDESLRLFAERGYAATSVAEIEAAAGLSPGAGGLYRHFRSKYEVLSAAMHEHVARSRRQVAQALAEAQAVRCASGLEERLSHLCRAGLAKVREEHELIQVFFRDLSQFPELVEVVRDGLLQPMFDAIPAWLRAQPEYRDLDVDWSAVAAVLGGAVVHYRLFAETVGEPPGHTDKERFIDTWVRLALGLLATAAPAAPAAPPSQAPPPPPRPAVDRGGGPDPARG